MTNSLNRAALYAAVNFLFAIAVVAGFAIHRGDAHPLYVVLLFAVLTTAIFDAKSVNGRYSLLVLWSADYFLMYGALDFRNLILGSDHPAPELDGIISQAEAVILLGAVLVQVAYRTACRIASGSNKEIEPRDWREAALVVVGIVTWVFASRLNWELSTQVLTTKSTSATQASLESIGGVKVGIYMIARMAQPVSILILAYAQCRYRRAYMTPVLIGIVAYQLLFGFIIDTKSEALIGGVLVVLTNLLVYGRVPKGWVALMLLVIALGFPILQANRAVRDERSETATIASENVVEAIKRAMAAVGRTSKGSERAQTALERLTTKSSIEIIVRGTGKSTPFQNGYTLTPIFTTFIPRLLWADKPSIPTGQIMNREFHVSEATETYISPSHLGELYWNFGWPGVIVGTTMIGLLFGTLGAKFDLSKAATLTRVLVVVVTVREVILQSEGEIATHYVVWLRSMVGIWLLHVAFARLPWRSRNVDRAAAETSKDATQPTAIRRFENLLS